MTGVLLSDDASRLMECQPRIRAILRLQPYVCELVASQLPSCPSTAPQPEREPETPCRLPKPFARSLSRTGFTHGKETWRSETQRATRTIQLPQKLRAGAGIRRPNVVRAHSF